MNDFLLESVSENEQAIQRKIDRCLAARSAVHDYAQRYSAARQLLGASLEPRVSPEKYSKIESRLFFQRRLHVSAVKACSWGIQLTATYTSPQGRNHWVRTYFVPSESVPSVLVDVRALREKRSTAEYQRRMERARVTPSVRADVFARDNWRCRWCGATAASGVTLHVDHVKPIAGGGTSDMDNLRDPVFYL